jgi:hypothetical protein
MFAFKNALFVRTLFSLQSSLSKQNTFNTWYSFLYIQQFTGFQNKNEVIN